MQLYFVIAIWGVEYVINMGSPEIEGYYEWLKLKANRSPLSEIG